MRLLEWSLTVRGHRFAGCLMVLGAILGGSVSALGQSWPGYGHDSQHTSLSSIASEVPQVIRWSTPVDANLQNFFGSLALHYGSPLITASNTVLVPVKVGQENPGGMGTIGFRIEAHRGSDGGLIWKVTSDYHLPTLRLGMDSSLGADPASKRRCRGVSSRGRHGLRQVKSRFRHRQSDTDRLLRRCELQQESRRVQPGDPDLHPHNQRHIRKPLFRLCLNWCALARLPAWHSRRAGESVQQRHGVIRVGGIALR